MIGNPSRWRNVALGLILVLLVCATPRLEVGAEDAAGPWRALFRRPATAPPAPADNPSTVARVALGARLFADPRLSGGGNRTCVSCHRPELAFTDARPRALALSGAPLRRNTPSLWNLAWSSQYFWDGRAPSLEAQVQMPIEAADEMAGHWPTIVARLEADTDLVGQFRTPSDRSRRSRGIRSRKRWRPTCARSISPPTRFDAWIAGDAAALSAAEIRGFRLFTGKAGCVLCHVGWRFTDDRFHDIGLPGDDPGRGAVAGGTPGLGAFKTPSLRELAHTAPYMHDGSLPTLTAVVAHYAGGFVARPGLAPHINRDLRLSAQEKADLVAFLLTLSTEVARP